MGLINIIKIDYMKLLIKIITISENYNMFKKFLHKSSSDKYMKIVEKNRREGTDIAFYVKILKKYTKSVGKMYYDFNSENLNVDKKKINTCVKNLNIVLEKKDYIGKMTPNMLLEEIERLKKNVENIINIIEKMIYNKKHIKLNIIEDLYINDCLLEYCYIELGNREGYYVE